MFELTRIRSRRRSVALLAAAVAVAAFAGAGPVNAGAPAPVAQAVAGTPDFGPNVTVIDPSMPTADIQAILDDLAAAQVNDEMGSNRHSVLFLPGDYGSVDGPAAGPRRLLHRDRRPRRPAHGRLGQRQARGVQPLPRPTAARPTASRSTTSGAPSRTSPCRSTRWGRTAAAPRRTSGRSRRRCRCAASTSPARTSR